MKKLQYFLIQSLSFLCFILFAGVVNGQQLSALKANDTIPLDPNVRIGKLSNGFTYYIRKNVDPKNQIDMHLVVRAGNMHEDDDQAELAHLLEHMPFVGTTHFQKPYEYFEKRGVKEGIGLTAYTGDNRTSYDLTIQSGNSELLQSGLLFLRDCAHGILLDPEKIDIERGAVLGELRSGNHGQNIEMEVKYRYKLMGESRFSAKQKLDSRKNLTEFKHQSLFRFYQDWYRPDLQAAIIVGDIDVDEIEKKIKSLFSDLKNPANPRKLPSSEPDFDWKNQFIVVTHKERSEVTIVVYMKRPYHKVVTREDFKESLVVELYNEMTAHRFNNFQSIVNRPFERVNSFDEKVSVMGPDFSAMETHIDINSTGIEQGFKAAMTELERIKRYGFTKEELDRAKESILRFHTSNPGDDSKAIADNFTVHFVEGAVSPDPRYRNELVNQLIREITDEDVNKKSREWISKTNRDIVVLVPEKDKDSLPDEATFLNWLNEIQEADLKPYEANFTKSLNTQDFEINTPTSSSYKRNEINEIGLTKIELANGVKVFLKPVVAERGQGAIYFHGFSPGGISLYFGHDFLAASYATAVVTQSGLDAFTKSDLDDFLKKKDVKLRPYIYDNSEGIVGSSKADGIDILLQFTHQYFTRPKKEKAVLEQIIANRKLDRENLIANPKEVLLDSVSSTIANAGLPTTKRDKYPSELNETHLEKAYEIYQERFANASDFTFVITGDFDVDTVTPLLVKYLGSLPAIGKKDKIKASAVHAPNKKISKRIYSGENDKADVELHFRGKYNLNAKDIWELDILQGVIREVLMHRLREIEGGTYVVWVTGKYLNFPENVYDLAILFTCTSDSSKNMISYAMSEIDNIKLKGPGPDTFERAMVLEKNETNENLKSARYWSHYLLGQLQNGKELTEILERENFLNKITIQTIRSSANKYLRSECLFEFVLLPEHIGKDPSSTKEQK